MSTTWYSLKGETLFLRVRAQPGAGDDEVTGVIDERLKIRVAARAANNAANARLTAFLAREFGVAKSRITLVSGHASRDKRFAIERPGRRPAWLESGEQG